MNQPLEWHTEQRRVNDLIPLDINPRRISEAKRMKMIESLQKFNLVDIPVVDADGTVISGHQRLRALQAIGRGEETIDVRQPNRQLTEKERKEYNVLANTHFGEFDLELFEEHFGEVELDDLGIDRADVFREEFAEPGAVAAPSGGNPANFDDPGIRGENKFGVIVMCGDAGQQESVYNDLTGMGYNCKIVVV